MNINPASLRNSNSRPDRPIFVEEELKEYEARMVYSKRNLLDVDHRQVSETRTVTPKLQSAFSPIHRLPPELLAFIFAQCQDPEDFIVPWLAPDIMSFSRVCGRWRDVGLTTPSLWSNVRVRLGNWMSAGDGEIPEDKMPRKLDSLIRVVQLFLDRSASSPLTLQLETGEIDCNPTTHPQVQTLLKVLAPTSRRWVSATLWLHPDLLNASVFRPIHANIPALEHLTFHPSEHSTDESFADIFDVSPSLTSLRLNIIIDRIDPIRFPAPWNQLTKLHLHWCAFTQVAPVLGLCSNVEDLTFTFAWTDAPSDVPWLMPVVCPRVRTLSVEGFTRDNPLCVLRWLTLPNLYSLIIQTEIAVYYPQHVEWMISNFPGFLARSGCTITDLRMRAAIPVTEEHLLRFCRRLPCLETITLVENQFGTWTEKEDLEEDDWESVALYNKSVITPNFLRTLILHHSLAIPGKPFLPNLKELSLSIFGRHLDQNALVEAAKSRWLPNPSYGIESIRKLSVRLMEKDPTPMETLEALYGLRKAGLKVDIYREHH